MVSAFINREKLKDGGYNAAQCLHMFGVPESSYYAWLSRMKDRDGKQAARKASREHVKYMMREVVRSMNGFVPGKRTFKTWIFRRFGETVNIKRIASVMKEMNLVASKPHRDAYKHQASHNHPCAAPANLVCQDFFTGPRKVILTDITYLYYGRYRSVFYLCVFRDAYTRENLGWSMSQHMDVGLVRKAYDAMMERHRGEIDTGKSSVYLHSDQGSQYLSTEFRELLGDDGFVQSVSARGNSQDNSPMESFFSRLKTAILDLVAMSNDLVTAMLAVDGYMKRYNSEYYQYDLAGLTPEEFYLYATTGIYPLDSYFGIPAEKLMAVGDLKKVRRAYADEEAAKRREAARKRNAARRLINPELRVVQDVKILEKKIREWKGSENRAQIQVKHLEVILEKCRKAADYIRGLAEDVRERLSDPLEWRNHEELGYVFDMNELF